jgi:citrate lyase subunit beta/citryl-CoA lyase
MTSNATSCLAPLFVPATSPERFAKALASGADAVIIDLEDAVATSEKAKARENLRFALGPFMVRINGSTTPWFADDVATCKTFGAAAIMLPKAERAEEMAQLQQLSNSIPVIALIESAKGLANARAIAASGVARLAFGSLDFAGDLGCAHEPDALLLARSELVMASRLAGIAAPLDGVTAAIDDQTLLKEDSRRAAALGFGGKLCIHPKQIETVQAAFRPTADEVAWAKKTMATAGDGVVNAEGAMVDAPVRRRAQRILSKL